MEEKMITVSIGRQSCLTSLRAHDLEQRDRINKIIEKNTIDVNRVKNDSGGKKGELNYPLTHRGGELEYPNIVMIDFKSNFGDMYGVLDSLNQMDKEKERAKNDIYGIWGSQSEVHMMDNTPADDSFGFLRNCYSTLSKKTIVPVLGIPDGNFDLFRHGKGMLTGECKDQAYDSIRFLLERSDYLAGFRLLVDTQSGWSYIGNMMKEYIRDECPKALLPVYGLENDIQEKSEYKKAFNDLFFYSEMKQDADLILKLSSRNPLSGLEGLRNDFGLGIEDYQMRILADSMEFNCLSSFYRKKDLAFGAARFEAYQLVPFPRLNIFSSYALLSSVKNKEGWDQGVNIFSIVNDRQNWTNFWQFIRFDSIPDKSFVTDEEPQKVQKQGIKVPSCIQFNDKDQTSKSIAECYSMISNIKAIEKMPPLHSERIKSSKLDALTLTMKDICDRGLDKSKRDDPVDFEIQTAMVNNPQNNLGRFKYILNNTRLNSIAGLKIKTEVNSDIIEEYRECILDLQDLTDQVREEIQNH